MTSSDKTKWKNYLRTVSVKLFQSVLFVSPSWSSSLSSSVKSQESRESLSRGTNDQWYCSTSLSLPSSQLFLSSLLINHESIRCTEQHFNSCLMFPVETFNDSCWSTTHDHTLEMITAPELRRDWAQCSVISSDAVVWEVVTTTTTQQHQQKYFTVFQDLCSSAMSLLTRRDASALFYAISRAEQFVWQKRACCEVDAG